MAQRVIVGISGGVDSSVTALLLKQQGFEVHGVFMKNWQEQVGEGFCPAEEDLRDAQMICDRLQIPLHVVEFIDEYRQRVFARFLQEYQAGRTPNPDILCNSEIKFRAFLDYGDSLGADFIATGHYARLDHGRAMPRLLKGWDASKDQSYFLHGVAVSQFQKVLFPLGEQQKTHIRQLARQAGLVTATKKDSTGVCFIGERDFRQFLQQYLPTQPGPMVDIEGRDVGQHQGLAFYTLGQRQGLGIGGTRHGSQQPWYVAAKRMADNTLVVVQGDHSCLYSQQLISQKVHWLIAPPTQPFTCHAKTRYRQRDQACRIYPQPDGSAQVIFDQAQRSVTPGQSVVFYQNDHCLGGGVIESTAETSGE